MNLYLLLAETAATDAPDRGRLILEYVIYAAIIVIGIIVLFLLRRAGRLPKHAELKKQLTALSDDLTAFAQTAATLTRYQFFRRITKFLYRAERLELTTSQLAAKERDGDIDRAAGCLAASRDLLSPYKFGKQDNADCAAVSVAAEKVKEAIAIMDRILARDAELRSRREKKA